MNSVLLPVLEALTLDKQPLREEAILQIAMILERHSEAPNGNAFYERVLQEELKGLQLSHEDQLYIANYLGDLIQNGKGGFDVIWALGKAKREIAFPLVVSSLGSQSEGFDEEFIWEALNALNKFVVVSNDDIDLEAQQQLLSVNHVENWLTKVEKIGSPRNQEKARGLLAKIDAAKPYL